MIEIAGAISLANAAFKGIQRAVAAGREIEDVAGYFGKFFDAKDQIIGASQYGQNQPMIKKLFSGSSVEAQALEITAAKHKMANLEKELREFLIYSGQAGFYEDMMKERRAIQQARMRAATLKAESRRFWFDMGAIAVGITACGGIIGFMASLITSAS